MYVKNVVICDSQKQYSENLFQVLTKSKSPEVQFYLFHSMQDAEQFAKEKKIYALLAGEEYPKEKRDRKSTRVNSSHACLSRMPSSA